MASPKLAVNDAKSKSDNDYSLQLNRWYLKIIGAWPQADTLSVTERIFVLLHILTCLTIVLINMIPCLLNVLLETISFQTKLVGCPALINRIMGMTAYLLLLKRSDDVRDCIRHMEVDWELVQKVDDRKVMLQHARFGRFLSAICGIMLFSTFLYGIAKGLKTVTILVGNETIRMHPMTCPPYKKIFDARFSPANEIMLTLQLLTAFIVSCSTVSACSLAAVFGTHACGQLNILYMKLDELTESCEKSDCSVKRKMVAIVEHHWRVLSFISRMESILHNSCFVLVISCTIIMSIVGYHSIVEWDMLNAMQITSYFIVYASMGFNIFIFCYIGDIVTEKCKHLGQVAYMTNWYNLHYETARNLILIIAQSSNVVKITAGKVLHLSIPTFGSVCKTSMVYLNMLRTVTL